MDNKIKNITLILFYLIALGLGAFGINYLLTRDNSSSNYETDNNIKENVVKKIQINENNLYLEIGNEKKLTYSTSPSNINVTNLKWSSSDTKVVSVDNNGKIKALSEGKSKITVKTDNNLDSSIMVYVTKKEDSNKKIDVSSVSLEVNNHKLELNDTFKLGVTISPTNATNKTIKWSSSDNDIVSVDENGNITGLKEGRATITATSNNGKSDICIVTVIKTDEKVSTVEVEKIELNYSSLNLAIGESSKLSATISPSNSSNKNITWTSSDSSIAKVDSNGNVNAIKEGSVTITVKSNNGKTSTCKVIVYKKEEPNKDISVESVKIDSDNLNLNIGDTYNLSVTIKPYNASNKSVTWSSSDSSIAKVDSNGKLTALKAGSITITAKTNNGKTSTSKVNITKKEEPTVIINVDSISLNKTSISVVEEDSYVLSASISPSNASNKTITWSSSDSSVAKVDTNGKITALKAGTATITAKSNNGKTSTCKVTVTKRVINVESIILNTSSINLKEGESSTLTATITPSNASNKTITWSSSDSGIAKVDTNGKITALKAGTATVTAKSNNGKTATCKVNVAKKTINVESVKLDKTTLSLKKGATYTLTATITPSDASNKTITWSSSDSSIAKVDNNGKVTAVKNGTATITAKSNNGKTSTCNVTVTQNTVNVESIKIDKTTLGLKEGSTSSLTVTITPSDASNKMVTWSSSNTSVATVSSSGKVTAVKEGTATITAKSNNGKTSTCNVTVTKNVVEVESIKLNNTSLSITEGSSSTLTVTLTPSNATDPTITWSTSNSNVAKVNSSGKVTAVKAGTATITAKTSNGKKSTCNVTVKEVELKDISLSDSEITLKVNQTYKLKVTFDPVNYSNQKVNYNVRYEPRGAVVSIDENGLITAEKAGVALVAARPAANTNIRKTILVKVVNDSSLNACVSDSNKVESLNSGKVNTYVCFKYNGTYPQNIAISGNYFYMSHPISPWCTEGQIAGTRDNVEVKCVKNNDKTIWYLSRDYVYKFERSTGALVGARYIEYAGHAQSFDVTGGDIIYMNYLPNTKLTLNGRTGSGNYGIAVINSLPSITTKDLNDSPDTYYKEIFPDKVYSIKDDGKFSKVSFSSTQGTSAYYNEVIKASTRDSRLTHIQVAVDDAHNRIALMDQSRNVYIYNYNDFNNNKYTLIKKFNIGDSTTKKNACGNANCGGQGIELYGDYFYVTQDVTSGSNYYGQITKFLLSKCTNGGSCSSYTTIKANKAKYCKTPSSCEVEGMSVINGRVYLNIFDGTTVSPSGKSKASGKVILFYQF